MNIFRDFECLGNLRLIRSQFFKLYFQLQKVMLTTFEV